MPPVQITIVYNKSNPFGIRRDAELLEALITSYNRSVPSNITLVKVKHVDLLEPPMKTDICIHLEIPSAGWAPFARTNILMINPEWWVPAWNSLLPRFDVILCKQKQLDISGCQFVPWCATTVQSKKQSPSATEKSTGCLWLLGGSRNKREFAKGVVPLWKAEYPPLVVYSTEPLFPQEFIPPPNVTLHVQEIEEDERLQLQLYYPIHICASCAEGFGHAAAEGERAGAFLILNSINAYIDNFPTNENGNVAFLTTPTKQNEKYPYSRFVDVSGCVFQKQFDTIFNALPDDLTEVRELQRAASQTRAVAFKQSMFAVLQHVLERFTVPEPNRHIPPILETTDCPPISIITPTFNRRKLIDIAFHNLVLTDYPKDKIEWVVVDDSNDPQLSVSDKISVFAQRAPVANVMYIPLPRKSSIGYKRNIGIERATNDIIVCMDDDDHYPETSFRRRVAWLTKHPWKPSVVGCTTIACYDLLKGVSAVNTPPWELSASERVSEATLTFYKSFWQQGKFTHTNIAEGDGFLKGREAAFLEIPPQQILVAFRHQGNVSSRCIPTTKDQTTGCFWGFPKEYLVWAHGLVGVQVEDTAVRGSREKNTKPFTKKE